MKKRGNLNLNDILNRLIKHGQLETSNKRKLYTAVKLVFEEIDEAANCGETVMIKGFGTFYYTTRPPRMGHNPKTGVKAEIPRIERLKFKQTRSRVNHCYFCEEDE